MHIETFYPAHPILKKHIEFYYFVKNTDTASSLLYYSFPHVNTALNIHKNINYEIRENFINVSEAKTTNFVALVNGIRRLPLLVAWNGCIDKITIHFKPLGLNQFIRDPYPEVVPAHTQLFTSWNKNEKHFQFLNAFYTTNDNVKRLEILELFLLSMYSPLEKQTVLEKAIELLSDFQEEHSIGHIAHTLLLTEKTFNRLFHHHLGISPVAYKKIARFRHSLNNKLINDQIKKLTEIAYESNFYDQSHFIKMYNKLTGTSPASFFNSIEKLADEKLIFKFTKQ